MVNFRDIVFGQIRDWIAAGEDIVILTNDMGAMVLDEIATKYPERVVNSGIAEQNMMSVAAGLAMAGKKVFTYGITAHVMKRCYEQIELDICSHNLPVIMLDIGVGLGYGGDGPTHHSNSFIGLLRTIPNLTIFNPIDSVSIKGLLKIAYESKRPTFFAIDKDDQPDLYPHNPEKPLDYGFENGLNFVLFKGPAATIISTGVLVHRACAVAKELALDGINVNVVDFYRLKPVNTEALATIIKHTDTVITLEEHISHGGISSIVAETMAATGYTPHFKAITLQDKFYLGTATRPYVHKMTGLDEQSVITTIKSVIEGEFKYPQKKVLSNDHP